MGLEAVRQRLIYKIVVIRREKEAFRLMGAKKNGFDNTSMWTTFSACFLVARIDTGLRTTLRKLRANGVFTSSTFTGRPV